MVIPIKINDCNILSLLFFYFNTPESLTYEEQPFQKEKTEYIYRTEIE